MSVEQVGVAFGVLLSLLMAYLPGFSSWYEAKTKQFKALFMLGVTFGAGVILFALSCAGFSFLGVVCSVTGAFSLLSLIVQVAIANQATYFLGVRPYKAKVRG